MTDKFSASEGAQISGEELEQFKRFKEQEQAEADRLAYLKRNAEICDLLSDQLGIDVFLADEIAETILGHTFKSFTIEGK